MYLQLLIKNSVPVEADKNCLPSILKNIKRCHQGPSSNYITFASQMNCRIIYYKKKEKCNESAVQFSFPSLFLSKIPHQLG